MPGHPELDGQRVQCGAFHADHGAWAVWPAADAGAPLSAPSSALTDPGTGAALPGPALATVLLGHGPVAWMAVTGASRPIIRQHN